MLEKNPPIIDGIFSNQIKFVGYLGDSTNPKEYTIDNPGVQKFEAGYKQNGIFVYTFDPSSPDSRKTYGMWKRKFNKNMCFDGWELYFSSSENNNTIYILEPTKICNNYVCEYVSTEITSGFNNNPPNTNQSSNIGQITGKKIKKN